MAHEFCKDCRINTRKKCASCPKTREQYESTATSSMPDVKTLRVYGQYYNRGDRIVEMSQAYAAVITEYSRNQNSPQEVKTPKTLEEYEVMIKDASQLFRALMGADQDMANQYFLITARDDLDRMRENI